MNKHESLPPNPTEPHDEELVAYLDGELSATARQRIERRLARDPQYRAQLSGLQEAWELLDTLPRIGTDHQLTQTTIAMVAKHQQQGTAGNGPRAARPARKRRWLQIVAAALIGFVVFSVPAAIWRNRILRDLPIASNLELYRYATDIQFLERLQNEGIFAEEESNDS